MDRTERCCFFTVENDFISKTLLYTPGLHPSALLHAAGADTYLGCRKHYCIPPFPPRGWPARGLQACGAGRERALSGMLAEAPCVLCRVFLFGNNLQPDFPWNFNSVTNTNGSALLRGKKGTSAGLRLGSVGTLLSHSLSLLLSGRHPAWNPPMSPQSLWAKHCPGGALFTLRPPGLGANVERVNRLSGGNRDNEKEGAQVREGR